MSQNGGNLKYVHVNITYSFTLPQFRKRNDKRKKSHGSTPSLQVVMGYFITNLSFNLLVNFFLKLVNINLKSYEQEFSVFFESRQ